MLGSKRGGRLIIETHDFLRRAQEYLHTNTFRDQMKILRHLFGSHQASWAAHYDGWYRENFEHVLTALGYQDLKFSTGEWQGTYNITVTGNKGSPLKASAEQIRQAEAILGLSLVDESPTEKRMLCTWMGQFESKGIRSGAA